MCGWNALQLSFNPSVSHSFASLQSYHFKTITTQFCFTSKPSSHSLVFLQNLHHHFLILSSKYFLKPILLLKNFPKVIGKCSLGGSQGSINLFKNHQIQANLSKIQKTTICPHKKKVGTWHYIVSLFWIFGGGFQYLVHIFNLWCRFGVVWAIDHIQFEGFPVARKVAATPSPIKDFLPNLSRRLFRKSSSARQNILGWVGWVWGASYLRLQLSAFHTLHPIKNFQSSAPKIENSENHVLSISPWLLFVIREISSGRVGPWNDFYGTCSYL